ncbi:hypothetical protein TrST_g2376 [Triparma strigata]|uniref:Uncharacterized protein n=1 Tax=Triparma strigata TaxID=1606541 RepID=A0A9W7ADX2_9STRA|nr:hypothetical protein TrST_g2376 [Triparma strigata]
MGSTLFISTTSARCLMNANLLTPVAKQCGNPLIPSFLVSVFLVFAWGLGVVVPPLLVAQKTLSWTDVIATRMSKFEGAQLLLFGTAATITLILFANLDEEGGDFTLLLQFLTVGFVSTISVLLFLVIYEAVVKPLMFPSTLNNTSNKEDDNDNDNDNDKDKDNNRQLDDADSFNFNMGEVV